MINCPACGKENEDSAFECRRCRAPLRDEVQEETPQAGGGSNELGMVCSRCEAYNEPGVRVCTACGYELFAAALAQVAEESAPSEVTPPDGSASISQELSALALSDQEAAEAGVWGPPPPRAKPPEISASPGGAVGRRAPPEPPPPPPPPARAPAPKAAEAAAPTEKPCTSCGAANPPAAKFCFDCGTPFIKKPEAPKAPQPFTPVPAPRFDPVRPVAPRNEPPPSIQVDASIQVDMDLGAEEIADSTAESSPVPAADSAPDWTQPPADWGQPPAEDEIVAAESVAEPIEDEPQPPFAAKLVVEKGTAQWAEFALSRLENTVGAGGSGMHVELADDAFVAPHAATLLFANDGLLVRDEGSANGVYVKAREPWPLESGDLFVAGERLFRFEGAAELAREPEGPTPLLGAPRPQGASVRLVEVLAGGKTGRTCHRAGPVIAIGRTGCDMNFPSDSLLAARHAEIRVGDDGSATLADLGQAPAGVWVRVRPQGQHPLQGGDQLQIGEQQLRVDVG